jgi:hypothetical protein
MKHCVNKRCKNTFEGPGIQCPECRRVKYTPKPKEQPTLIGRTILPTDKETS